MPSTYIRRLQDIMARIDLLRIERVVETMFQGWRDGKQFFFLGNGGSFATASHSVNDFSKATRVEGKAYLKVIPLTDPSIFSAYANDDGYEKSFVRQLESLLEEGDIVTGISASGNSPNILKAIEYANQRGAKTIGWVGFDGGKLAKLAQQTILVPTEKGEYGPVEDCHMIINHIISGQLREKIERTR